MGTTLQEFIASRKAEIKEQIAALRKELQDIQAAENAVTGGIGSQSTRSVRNSDRMTMKDMILKVLEKSPRGADALEIINLVKETYGKEIPRPSISPQLSRLKTEGKLNLEDKIWTLAIADCPNKEAPEGASLVGETRISPDSDASGFGQTQEISVDDLL